MREFMSIEERHHWLDLRLQGKTYREIAALANVQYQYVQHILAPPKDVRRHVAERANYTCEKCGVPLRSRSAEVHHDSGDDAGNWHDIDRLHYLCKTDHWAAHGRELPASKDQAALLVYLPTAKKRRLAASAAARQLTVNALVEAAIDHVLAL